MLNDDLASQLIGLVRHATTKPIRFLVNTSYHGDHAYGNFLFPDSTVVIQHPATKRYIDEKFEDDRRFMIGLMDKGKGIERVQARSADITVADMISVDLGGRVVEVRHFGFAQTPGDLVIWAPEAKVLWVGNISRRRRRRCRGFSKDATRRQSRLSPACETFCQKTQP